MHNIKILRITGLLVSVILHGINVANTTVLAYIYLLMPQSRTKLSL